MPDKVTVLGPGDAAGADFLADLEQSSAAAAELEARERRTAGGRPRTNGAGYRANRGRLECQSCGFICRASAGALERSGRPSCGCGAGPLALTSELEAHELECEESAQRERLEVRRYRAHEREQSSGYETHAYRCDGCGRYRSRPADRCEYCGDSKAVYGPDEQRDRREVNRAYGYAD
jgi:hypothetical protein